MSMNERKLLVLNWKSHKTLTEAKTWLATVGPKAALSEYTLVLCPPFPFVEALHKEIENKKYHITLGVQDLSPFPAGAYTGAVSARNLEELDVKYTIVGHSERRKYFHETMQEVANKVSEAIAAGITPIVCVDKEHIEAQANAILESERGKCIVAYEPVGHIGTGEVDDIKDVLTVAEHIREAFGEQAPVLYGGSVDGDTADMFLKSNALHGALVGGASLSEKEVLKMAALMA